MAFNNANISADLVTALDNAYPDIVLRKHHILGLSTFIRGGGSSVTLPVKTGYTTSVGTSMSATTSATSSTKRKAFVITQPNPLYLTSTVDLMEASWTDDPDHAAVDVMMDEAKSTAQGMGNKVERALFGSGYGVIGTIGSQTGSTPDFVVTLTKPADALNFQVGQVIKSKATAATGSLVSGSCTVAAVNLTAGTVNLTSDGTWTCTNGYVLGDANVIAASTSPVIWPGLAGWNPDVDNLPGVSDSFFGVNRYGLPGAAGTAIDCTSMSVKQALNTLLQQMSIVDGIDVDTAFLNPTDFGKLMDDLASQKEFVEVTGEMGVNYSGVKFEGPNGPISIISAPFAIAGIIRVADSSVFKIKSPDKKPICLKDDNKTGYMASTTDDVGYFTMRANFIWYPTNPAALGNAKLY